MKFVPTAITQFASKQLMSAKMNSPQLMLGGAVVGVVATAVLASRATLKLDKLLTEASAEMARIEAAHESQTVPYSDHDYTVDRGAVGLRFTLDVAKTYGPAVICGAVTIGLMIGSNRILSKRNAALVAAYSALHEAYNEYRKRVIAEYGEDVDKKFLYDYNTREVIQEGKSGHEVKTVTEVSGVGRSQYAVIFDESNPNWQRKLSYNQFFISQHQNWANDRLRSRGFLFLNDVYKQLGFPETPQGQIVGWLSKDRGGKDGFVDFCVFDGDIISAERFVNGDERSVILDFNVDGPIWDKL